MAAVGREQHLRMVGGVYESVVKDVVESCREFFREEGQDEEILNELKHIWESKIRKSGCVPFYGLNDLRTVINVKIKREGLPDANTPDIKVIVPRAALEKNSAQVKQELVAMADKVRKEGLTDADAKYLIENRLEEIFGQDKISQMDGPSYDSSDDSLSDSDSDSPAAKRAKTGLTNGKPEELEPSPPTSSDEDEKAESEEEENPEPPLTSADDLSDMGPELMFETDNLCICLYTTVESKRNQWDIGLTNGVMSLDGVDYLFSELKGCANWL